MQNGETQRATIGPGGRMARARRGLSIFELLVSFIILSLLITLLVIGISKARTLAGTAVQRQTVVSLRLGVEAFEQEFGFLPPLVKDSENPGRPGGQTTPVSLSSRVPNVFSFSLADANMTDREYLRGWPGGVRLNPDSAASPLPDLRFSVHSLPYYLMGTLDHVGSVTSATPIDGVAGSGFLAPRIDGSFEQPGGGRTGKVYEPFFDASRRRAMLYNADAAAGRAPTGRIELRDRSGVPIRFYRWLRGAAGSTTESVASLNELNVPRVVGDPNTNGDLREATFAIVAAGDDGYFGDMPLEADTAQKKAQMMGRIRAASDWTDPQIARKAREDNLVEVGR